MYKNLKKNFIWNLIGTLLNSFLSLFLLILVTRINGIKDAGIFSFGFSIACLLFYIGMYFGRVFQVTENKQISDKCFLVTKIFTFLLMILISLIYLLIKQYNTMKFSIIFGLCVLKALEAFADVFYGFMQKNDELYLSGISLSLKNIIGFLIFFIIDYKTKNVFYSILGIIIIYLIVLVCFDFFTIKKYNIWKGKIIKKDICLILKNGFYPFALSFFSLMVINSPRYAIDAFLTDDLQTYFGIIVMPATIVSLAAQFIIYPFLTEITELIRSKNYKKLEKFTINFVISVFFIGIIGTIFASILGIPLLEFIYNLNLLDYKNSLIIIMIGATFNASVFILSNILISFRKLKLQTFIYFIVTIISYVMARIFVSTFSIYGACYSYTLTMFMLFLLFCIIMKLAIKKLGEKI